MPGMSASADPRAAAPIQAVSAENAPRRGHHKVYVGMASGVGKTYRALGELHELLAGGRRVVVGVLETHGRAETQEAAAGLPVFPRKMVDYKGARLSEMDLDGLLEMRPEVVLVDDLAHASAPGSRFEKRYEAARALLEAGIDVISTVNIQHLESLNDVVARLTGVRVRDRLPDQVLQDADEVLLVDVTPQTLQERLRAGKIYAPEKADLALRNFYTEENLTALRELALRQVADVVQGEPENNAVSVAERILVACAAEPESGRLIRRGGRIASRLNTEFDVVYVESARPDREQQKLLDFFRETTEDLGGRFVIVPNQGGVGPSLVRYAREHHVTQVVLGESSRSRWQEFLRGSVVHTVLRETKNVDVYVITRE